MRKKADFCDYAHMYKLGAQKSLNPGLCACAAGRILAFCACAHPSVITVHTLFFAYKYAMCTLLPLALKKNKNLYTNAYNNDSLVFDRFLTNSNIAK